jgi:NitT/TauT family transport system ATP-binding protein
MTPSGASVVVPAWAESPHRPSPATQRAPALSFRAVSKTFPDGTAALADVSFDASASTIVSIVGPSGCGKSTLLRIASGLSPASSGEVRVEPGSVGYVFQDATLLPWRTVRRNVELFAELHGLPKAERQQLVREAIALVGLSGFENYYPNALSGGMRMRASIARALTMKPQVFLFDEPFGALDEISRQRMNEELLRLYLLQGFGGLLVTHSVYEAVYLSSRVLIMSSRPGRILADIPIPFSYPRAPDLRFLPAFAELAGAVSEILRKAGD